MSECSSGQERSSETVDTGAGVDVVPRRGLRGAAATVVVASCLVMFVGLPPLHGDDVRDELTYGKPSGSSPLVVASSSAPSAIYHSPAT
jgi:hypothetical protein